MPPCELSPTKNKRHKWGPRFPYSTPGFDTEDRLCEYCGKSEMTLRDTQRAREAADEKMYEAEEIAALRDVDTGDDSPTLGETLRAMGKTILTGEEPLPDIPRDEFGEPDYSRPWPGEIASDESLSDIFDKSAKLSIPSPTTDTGPIAGVGSKATKRMPRAKASGRPAGSDQFADLFAAGFILIIAFVDEDFLPTEQEAKDLTRPLANILARRIDLAAKLGQDTDDAVAFAVAVMSYTVRVGPIAVAKTQESWRDRQNRTRVRTITEPADSASPGDVPFREDERERSIAGANHRPIDALAKARSTQWGAISRDLGNPANGYPSVVD